MTNSIHARIAQLRAIYGATDCSAATLLCDRHDPGSIAYRIIDESMHAEDLSYGELRAESERFAAVLSGLGIQPGDRVATLTGKSREYLIVLMGIWRLGAVHVPLFTAFASPAVAFRLFSSAAKLVVCDASQREKLRPLEDVPQKAPWQVLTIGNADAGADNFHTLMAYAKPGAKAAALGGDAPLVHIYTSGTTGAPKAVVVPTRALASFHMYAEYALDLQDDDVYWCAADPGWAYGLYFGLLGSFTTGTRSLLLEGGFSPVSTFDVLASERVTNFAAAPTVYRAMRKSGLTPGDIRLRCASSAGEPLTPEVNEWATVTLGVAVHDHYGQTETGMLINNHHHPALRKPLKQGSMGCALPGYTVVVLCEHSDEIAPAMEIGRVAVDRSASPLNWFDGYLNDPTRSAENFSADGRWYLTGDKAFVDGDGYFHFSSRDDDVITMMGYRIGPLEIESSIAAHPAVVESAVIGVPDDIRGEVIEAYVVLRNPNDASKQLAAEIKRWVKMHYAAHAYPRMIHFTPVLPKTPSGKVQRFALRQQRREQLRLLSIP